VYSEGLINAVLPAANADTNGPKQMFIRCRLTKISKDGLLNAGALGGKVLFKVFQQSLPLTQGLRPQPKAARLVCGKKAVE